MNLKQTIEIANQVISRLNPYCQRLEIAGSVRRMKPFPGDLELVAIPKTIPLLDLFGNQIGETSILYDRKLMESLGIVQKFGKRQCQVALYQDVQLDLFIVLPPAQWPVIFTIRTGPPDFSKWIVTPRNKGGALPNGWRSENGRIWDGQSEMKFEEELDFLKFLGLDWIEPKDRQPRWNYFRRPK